jgi:hypothetical protein
MTEEEKESGWIPIKDIKPHPDNARTHDESQLEKIAKSIDKLGWARPIIISKDNHILAGHGAAEAAQEILHHKSAPFRRVEYNHDQPEAIAIMDSDNRLAELSDWNYGKLETHFEGLKLEGFDLTLTGFDEDELKKIKEKITIPDFQPTNITEQPRLDKLEPIICPHCGNEIPR